MHQTDLPPYALPTTLGIVQQGLVGSVGDDATSKKGKILESFPLEASSHSHSPSRLESKKLEILDENIFFHNLNTSVWRSLKNALDLEAVLCRKHSSK